ncbi:acyl-CoA dehydrogenase family protein [Craurococcus roseus]|uniref:Acyl-CoA dehydrogenase family protein n=1 Tax=Craurococcus roseus TaxID=77585 RepID=A0ABN1G562_9PROT
MPPALRRPAPPAMEEAPALDRLRSLLPAIAARAAALDVDGAFPGEDIAALATEGLLRTPLPEAEGGQGWGTAPAGAAPLCAALRLVGRASLPLGRIFEGHVNAAKLVLRRGNAAQAEAAARDLRAGRLFGVWNTDPPGGGPPLTLENGVLKGRKVLCSGAGWVERALVTARDAGAPADAPTRMALVPLERHARADLSGWTAQGMRASATGAVDFTGLRVGPGELVGQPGDYLAQPDFSAGAWRFAAVHCGGVEAVLGALRDHLRRTGRGADPHQAARLGQAAMAAETARLWVEAAAAKAEAPGAGVEAVAHVGLARLAVERAALDVLELAQRSVGLQAFMRPSPLERLVRDLATYLRQPAPDRVLSEAAAFVLSAPQEPGDLWG